MNKAALDYIYKVNKEELYNIYEVVKKYSNEDIRRFVFSNIHYLESNTSIIINRRGMDVFGPLLIQVKSYLESKGDLIVLMDLNIEIKELFNGQNILNLLDNNKREVLRNYLAREIADDLTIDEEKYLGVEDLIKRAPKDFDYKTFVETYYYQEIYLQEKYENVIKAIQTNIDKIIKYVELLIL